MSILLLIGDIDTSMHTPIITLLLVTMLFLHLFILPKINPSSYSYTVAWVFTALASLAISVIILSSLFEEKKVITPPTDLDTSTQASTISGTPEILDMLASTPLQSYPLTSYIIDGTLNHSDRYPGYDTSLPLYIGVIEFEKNNTLRTYYMPFQIIESDKQTVSFKVPETFPTTIKKGPQIVLVETTIKSEEHRDDQFIPADTEPSTVLPYYVPTQ